MESLLNEGLASVDISGVFYNPYMKLSRDISVEVIRRIDDELEILDGFSASGIRGIRYSLESKNVKRVDFLDFNQSAIDKIRKNININGIDGNIFKTKFEDFQDFNNYNFIEIDPFGSPSKYIPIVISRMRRDVFYLSVTATDTAVLCGKHWQACIRNYIARPIRDRTCHETGLRILIAYIAKIAFIYDYNITPLMSFYYRHQMKTIIQLRKDVRSIHDSLGKIDFIHLDDDLNKGIGIGARNAGPLWIDKYYSERYLDISIPLVKQISQEINIPFHYDLHELAEFYKIPKIPKLDYIIRELGGSRTHFNPKGIKWDRNIGELVEFIRSQL
ncbi:MAG: hypothetical protein QXH89_02765 [Candidatus Anstonellales archaeon]